MQRRKIRQQRRAIGLYVQEDSKLFSKSVTSLGTSSLLTFHSVCIQFLQSLFNFSSILLLLFCFNCLVFSEVFFVGGGVKSYGDLDPKVYCFFCRTHKKYGKGLYCWNCFPLIKGNFENFCRVISNHVNLHACYTRYSEWTINIPVLPYIHIALPAG